MDKWRRFLYCPVIPLGENGQIVTGSERHITLSRQAAAEGMVLLKNENALLPLKRGSKVALFGKASADYVKGGGGSGDVTVAYVRNLCDGMEEKQSQEKLTVFAPLNEFYRSNVAQQRKEGKEPGYTVEPEVPAKLLADAEEQCDTAIISICRYSSEGGDRKGEANDGDFYLSCEEQGMVSAVLTHFDHVVVVLNVGGMVDTTWFRDEPKIGAVLLAWQGGMEGAMAEADILCGDKNPSGKLTDTFAASLDDYPSSAGFNESEDYVCYTDDIFVGYRYFETIPGAAERVNYPFGFGLSYTTFEWKLLDEKQNNEDLFVVVEVRNTGKVAGREVMQLYSAAPKCDMDMPKLELRGFQKTRLLLPGETERLTLCFRTQELAAYDEKRAAYVLPAGRYTLKLGNCIRNLRIVGYYDNAQEQIVCQLSNRCVPSKLPKRLRVDGSYETLNTKEYVPLYDTTGWPDKHLGEAEHILPDNRETGQQNRPNFGKVVSGEETMDAFLDSLTDDELITLLGGTPNRGVADTRGLGGLDYLEIPAVMTADGPAGLRIVRDRGIYTTAWPVATLLACSWDTDLLYAVGQAGAKEVLENNLAMWLTPAINIHRSPLCGRNFEYYSEDPLLTGKMAAAMVRGVQSLHISACIKHLCCNNKEANRCSSDSRISERALREIYLKPFQIVIAESDVWAVMTSYNLLNGSYTSENSDLLTGILRGEWSFRGLIITDWGNWAEHYREVLAGSNVRMPFGSPKRLQRAMKLGLIHRKELKDNTKYLLEFLMKLE